MSFVSISSISFRISCCFISTTSTISDASWCLWAPMQHLMQIGVWQSWQWTSHLWPWWNLHSGNTQCIFLFLNGTISCDRDWNLSTCLLTQFTHKLSWQLLQNSMEDLPQRWHSLISCTHDLNVAMSFIPFISYCNEWTWTTDQIMSKITEMLAFVYTFLSILVS